VETKNINSSPKNSFSKLHGGRGIFDFKVEGRINFFLWGRGVVVGRN